MVKGQKSLLPRALGNLGKYMFIPLKLIVIGVDPPPYDYGHHKKSARLVLERTQEFV